MQDTSGLISTVHLLLYVSRWILMLKSSKISWLVVEQLHKNDDVKPSHHSTGKTMARRIHPETASLPSLLSLAELAILHLRKPQIRTPLSAGKSPNFSSIPTCSGDFPAIFSSRNQETSRISRQGDRAAVCRHLSHDGPCCSYHIPLCMS